MWTPNLVQTQTDTHRGYKYTASTNLTINDIHGVPHTARGRQDTLEHLRVTTLCLGMNVEEER